MAQAAASRPTPASYAAIGAVGLALSVAACAPVEPLGNAYTVAVDPAWSPADTESILAAASDWTAKVPDLRLSVVSAPCQGIHDGQICLHPAEAAVVRAHGGDSSTLGITNTIAGPNAVGNTGGTLGIDGGETFVDVATIHAEYGSWPWVLTSVVEHEMAHAMGLLHESGAILMNPDVNQSSGPYLATCVDIAQWYGLRDRVVPICD